MGAIHFRMERIVRADFSNRGLMWVVVLGVWVGIVMARVWGPSDLYDKEQPRTTSYTVDMIESGHWVLPVDTFGIPATKPPLFNWVSVPFVEGFGFREWALKMPSVLGSLGAVLGLMVVGRRMFGGGEGTAAGGVMALLWLSTPVTVKLMYVARPDMLLTGFLTGAWVAATVMVREAGEDGEADGAGARRGTGRRRFLVALAFWVCTLGAALTKGPLAIFALLYLPLAAVLIGRDWKIVLKSGWWWGLPLVVGVMGWWAWAAYRVNPEFFREVLLGREVANRMGGWKVVTTFFNGPAYVITRFLPWSLAAVGGIFLAARGDRAGDGAGGKRWFAHPLGPAMLWIAMIMVVFSFASTKRPDRYAPVYPAMAVMAGYTVVILLEKMKAAGRVRFGMGCVVIAAVCVAAGMCIQNQFFSEGARTHYGEHVAAFARAVKEKVGNDAVLFLDGEQTPLETLMGNVQADPAPVELQERAKWCVRFYEEGETGREPAVISQPIAQVDGREAGRLGLYKLGPGEGVAAFEKARGVPVIYAVGENVGAKGAGEVVRWVQFWRVHTGAGK